jgi:hypothetical protein
VNGEYDETPIVHMLLDPNDDFHFLKLNKTFLGDGNANDFAMVADSAYFDKVEAYIYEIDDKDNGLVSDDDTTRFWLLKDTIIENKNPGLFYHPEQKLYFFEADDLNEDFEYHLNIDIENGKHTVSGQTELVKNINISSPNVNQQLNFAGANVPLNGYNTQAIAFSEGTGAVIYKVQIQFNYRDYKPTGNVNRSVTWDVGTLRTSDLNSATAIGANGEAFYEFLANSIPEDSEVTKRTVRSFDLLVTAGSEELNTYMLTNEPTSSLAQNKPTFSNVDGGLGIFSARTTAEQNKPFQSTDSPNIRALSVNSTRELCEGQYTIGLKFCSDNTNDISQGYSFACN